jgi:hypothetical protein
MRAKFVNEGGIEDLFSDEGNLRALKSWRDKVPEDQHEITILEPITIQLDQEKDYNMLKFLFQKYRVKFEERVLANNFK